MVVMTVSGWPVGGGGRLVAVPSYGSGDVGHRRRLFWGICLLNIIFVLRSRQSRRQHGFKSRGRHLIR